MRTLLAAAAALAIVSGVVVMVRTEQPRQAGNVTEARVLAESARGDNWPVDGGTFGQPHFSPLKQITDANVDTLGVAWTTEIDSPMGMSSEPLVVDGVVYVSAAFSRVNAIDAATGNILWQFDPQVRVDRMRNSMLARANRGVALYAGKVFVGTGDCRLVAIDAASGKKLWESLVCDPEETGITGAPHVAKGSSGQGIVFVGYNGGDTGVRGSVVAFDQATGKEVWRFWTVPGDPAKGFENHAMEMAAKTWSGNEWWNVKGGDDWDPITYDPLTDLIFIGTAGSTPDELFGDRADMKVGGERLFSSSTIAIKATTGEYVWHYQTKPVEENFHIIVSDVKYGGTSRRVAMTVPRNGIFQVLDARTGELISAKRLDDALPHPNQRAGRGSTEIGAGHNWWHMSYSPLTGFVYVPGYDERSHVLAPGEMPLAGKLFAWNPATQSLGWSIEEPLAVNGGVLSTAGNLLFQGQGTGEFAAYTADTGKKVWSIKTGSAIQATPTAFSLDGVQYIVVPVGYGSLSRNFDQGSNLGTPESKRGPSRLLAFKLGATTPFRVPRVYVPPVPRPPAQTASADAIKAGAELYNKHFCFDCHSPNADGSGAWTVDGAIPDLRYMPSAVHGQWNNIVLRGSHRNRGMPGFGTPAGFPIVKRTMTQKEADDIHAYVIDQSWKAYNEQQARLKK
jgi:quinohemoprotein ethanol dehydrogenase